MAGLSSCRTLGEVLQQRATERPGAAALVSVSGRRASARWRQTANGLVSLGIKPGDRIAYLGKNTDHFWCR